MRCKIGLYPPFPNYFSPPGWHYIFLGRRSRPKLSFSPLLLEDGPTQKGKSKIKNIWVFPKIGVPQNGWFIMENSIKMDDLGYHYFRKHPYARYLEPNCAPPISTGSPDPNKTSSNLINNKRNFVQNFIHPKKKTVVKFTESEHMIQAYPFFVFTKHDVFPRYFFCRAKKKKHSTW